MLIAATTSNVITAATAHSAFRRLVIKPPVQKPPSLSILFLPKFCCFDYRTNLPGKLASCAKNKPGPRANSGLDCRYQAISRFDRLVIERRSDFSTVGAGDEDHMREPQVWFRLVVP